MTLIVVVEIRLTYFVFEWNHPSSCNHALKFQNSYF